MKWWIIKDIPAYGRLPLHKTAAISTASAAPPASSSRRRFILPLLLLLGILQGLTARAAEPLTTSVSSVATEEEDVTADAPLTAEATTYERNTQRLQRSWSRLAPNQVALQYAGSIGAAALGVGWHYGRRDHWESELLLGYVPHSNGSKHHYTLTGKQRYIPWHIALTPHRRWELEPLTAGLFANVIFGEGYWRHAPSKYTKGYYGFNTKLRWNLYIGQRWRYNIPRRNRRLYKSVSLYYELSTSDLKLVSAIPNRQVTLGDILSLAVGLRLEIF
jgi:hypothetical protein